MAVAVEPAALRTPLPGGTGAPGVRVHPLRTGEILLPPLAFERPTGPLAGLRGMGLHMPRSRWHWVPVPAFAVEHPCAGTLLVDAGLHASVASDPTISFGRLLALLRPLRQAPGEAAPDQLRARGIDPGDVRAVVMTHLHNDHSSGIAQFPQATFVVTRLEWQIACAGGPRQGYVHAHFDHPFDWRTFDPADPDAKGYAGFNRAFDLFGDGSVRLLSTPGHTRGHQSVLLRLASGRELLLTGDAAYTRRSLDEELVPIYCADEHLYMRSLRELRAHVAARPGTVVVCGHDAEGWPTLEPVYE
jgi:N-acyl homoserine lactone hydrolase